MVIVDAEGNPIPTVIGTAPPPLTSSLPAAQASPPSNKAQASEEAKPRLTKEKSEFSLKTQFPEKHNTETDDHRPMDWIKPATWISWLAHLERQESPEVKELRKKVEQEEIKRYMDNFKKVRGTL